MRTVKDLIKDRLGRVHSVEPGQSVYEALKIMAEKKCGLLTVQKNQDLLGVISERDYARRVIIEGRTARDTKVSEIMTEDVRTVTPDQSIRECMSLMSSMGVRHLPVVGAGRVVGVISIGDVLQSVIAEQDYAIEQLEKELKNRIMLTPVQFQNMKRIAEQQSKNIGSLLREAVHQYLAAHDPRGKPR